METITVLLVEDEQVLSMIIKETLSKRGFEIQVAANGIEGWSRFNQCKPDICVVDIMMPRKDGLSLVEDIRKVNPHMPIIFLTAKAQTEDVLKGFEAGADDYMKKPFSMEELIMRMKSLLRRSVAISGHAPNGCQTASIGNYRFDYQRLELVHHDKVVTLSQREGDLLQLLVNRKHQLLDKRTALLKIWGDDNIFNSRSMDVYITKLRKYLYDDAKVKIINIRGRGYKIID